MAELDQLLGFDRQIPQLANRFLRDGAKRLVVRGPSGVGKTTFVQTLSRQVEAAGCDVIRLAGDPGRTEESFYPIRAALQIGIQPRYFGRGLRIIEGIVDDFLPKGKATAKALIALFPRGKTTEEIAALQTSEVSKEFVGHLARVAKARRVLIIADDIQYFDIKTLLFLESLIDLKGAESGLRDRIALLSVLNEDVPVVTNKINAVEELTSTLASVKIENCSEAQFESVLKSFGLKVDLPADVVRLLYECSGGHLHIARFICDELRTLPLSEMTSASYADLLQFVIRRRLEQMPIENDLLVNLLCSGAFIGCTFTFQELACLARAELADVRHLIHVAETLHFVECYGETVQFSHEIMRSFFLRQILKQRSQYSARYSECLRILRPSDYYARSMLFLDAGDREAAVISYYQGLIAGWRAGRIEEDSRQEASSTALTVWRTPDSYLSVMREGHRLLASGDFRAARLLLESSQEAVEATLMAEKDYLLAEALLKDLGTSSTLEAIRILQNWDGLKDKEPELWCRIRLLLLLAHTQLGQYEELKHIEREIIMFLGARVKFDRAAERQLKRLLAISEMHSSAEISRRRILQACDFYEQKLRDEGFADLCEYFICLTNRSGNAITNIEFAQAIDSGCRALALCRDYPMIRFPAQWAAANNVAIAAVLDGRMLPQDAIACLRELLERFPDLDDDILIHSNIGSLAILADDSEAAFSSFAINTARFEATPDIDPYYLYLSESNRALALQGVGATSAQKLWNSCDPLINSLFPAIRADLRARHDALSALFASPIAENSATSIENSRELVIPHPRYRSSRFPKGVFMSDIQIWSSF